MKKENRIYLVSILVPFVITFLGYPFMASLSFGFLIFWLHRFIVGLKINIPIRELAMVTASIQYLVSSFLAFYVQSPDPVFAPNGNPDDYFVYAIPGVLFYGLGLFSFMGHKIQLQTVAKNLTKYDLSSVGKRFIIIGWLAFLILPFVPSSLNYFFVLLSNFTYIGGLCILFSSESKKNKWILISIAFVPVIKNALYSGVFFLAIMWVAILVIYFLFRYKYSYLRNFFIIIFGIYFLIVIDMSKKDYRNIVWQENQITSFDKIGIFIYFLYNNALFNSIREDSNFSARITRANQGAIVTWVMNYVPSNTPYAKGSTIREALEASVLPRFLNPNKATAGGLVNFQKFTGRPLINTSINLGLLGEGWANFGYTGGLAFMYFVGLFFSYILKIMFNLMNRHSIYFLFIPYILIFMIKAEDDLLTPLNHIIKSGLILLIFHYLYLKNISRRFNLK